MLTLALSLTLFGAAPEGRARLVSEELLSPVELQALRRELRVLDGNIMLLKPQVPRGFVVGMALGFSFSVLLLPGIPLTLVAATSSAFGSALLAFGGVLTGVGGVALLVALICAVLGTNAEANLADERAELVRQRDAIKQRLAPYLPGERDRAPSPPGYVPGVRLELPAPRLVTLARF